MASRFLICLLLTCVALPVAAREVARMDANGAGAGCPVTEEVDTETDTPRATDKRATVATASAITECGTSPASRPLKSSKYCFHFGPTLSGAARYCS